MYRVRRFIAAISIIVIARTGRPDRAEYRRKRRPIVQLFDGGSAGLWKPTNCYHDAIANAVTSQKHEHSRAYKFTLLVSI